ncbi:DUF2970 domain-containing protein [Colwellia sp. MEBiC06753]
MAKSTLTEVLKSVVAAFFGVQSDKNREKDFNEGKAIHFIIAGAIAAILFVIGLVLVVSLVLPA